MTEKQLYAWTKKYYIDLEKNDAISNYQLRILKVIIGIVSETTESTPTLRQVFLYMNNHSQDYVLKQINEAVKKECISEYLDVAVYERIKETLYHTLYITIYLSPWFETEELSESNSPFNKVETA